MGFLMEGNQKPIPKMATKPLLTPTEGRKLKRRVEQFVSDMIHFEEYYNSFRHKIIATQVFPELDNGRSTGKYQFLIYYEEWI